MRKKVKRKKNHHLNRLKTRKAGSSWFKLVYFDIFLLIYFRFSTIIIIFATKYHLSIPQIILIDRLITRSIKNISK